jgi:alkanesulfonate monooxygenase SsuD/methylene tetrahydromethanopterin reductase-like flavin-dependent oxidoreductase (luciferase family)
VSNSLRFGVCYDFRNPPDSEISTPRLYAEVLDQIEWLDRLGLDLVWFTEHHFVEDGYLPAWIPVASAAAARTSKVRFSCDICLLPFNNPVRLAEDLAVLDNLSNGRAEIGIGMGYAPHEFRGFGMPVGRRLSLTEEGLEVLKLCFKGDRFSYHGNRYQFNDVVITPGYVQEGGPPLWIGAMSAAGARRAARFDSNLLPQGSREDSLDTWLADLKSSGRNPANYRIGIIKGVLVTDDREGDWPRVRESERYRMQLYNRFFAESKQPVAQGGQAISQRWVVGSVDECVAELTGFIREFGITDLVTWGCPPGLTPDMMNRSMERFATEVVPRVKADLGE